MNRRYAGRAGSPSSGSARSTLSKEGAVLVIDEVQKAVDWAEAIERL